jgi:putative ATP-binding cassette transporter
MQLILFIFRGNFLKLMVLLSLGLLTGGLHVLLLIVINQVLETQVNQHTVRDLPVLTTVMLLTCSVVSNRLLSRLSVGFSQRVIHETRLSMMRHALLATYLEMEEHRQTLYSAITRDAVSVANSAVLSLQFLTSLVTVAGCLIYLGFLSLPALLFIAVLSLLGVGFYLVLSGKSQQYFRNARGSEDALLSFVRQFIDGFREIKINITKGQTLVDGPLQEASQGSMEASCKGYAGYHSSNMVSQLLLYLALIIILFLGADLLSLSGALLTNCMIVILFMIGPLESATTLLTAMAEGNVAAGRIQAIEGKFLALQKHELQEVKSDFGRLSYQGVAYQYPATLTENGFRTGPICFDISRQELVFIHGGNGAGKTTFLYLLLGLLPTQSGLIKLDGEVLPENAIGGLFSPVFANFHLFDRFYALAQINLERAEHYLKIFEMDHLVRIADHKFSRTDLSTGQRKRLALIGVLLENRPILLLDEWAADQDPMFRRKFYNNIMPMLQSEGFTIIAVTHDDHYFDVADSIYHMEFGQLTQRKGRGLPAENNK